MIPEQALVFLVFAAQLSALLCSVDTAPLQMIVFGNAGSGKTWIFKALEAFYTKLQCSPLMTSCAFTGSAAAQIHGSTAHHLFRWSLKSLKSMEETTPMRRLCRTIFWKSLHLLVHDEFSNDSGSMIHAIHESINQFRELQGEKTEPFGGLDILFMGDPQQLSPPGRTSLFDSLDKYPPTKTRFRDKLGQQLWRSIPFAVELPGFQRFEKQYGTYLNHVLDDSITDIELHKMQQRQIQHV